MELLGFEAKEKAKLICKNPELYLIKILPQWFGFFVKEIGDELNIWHYLAREELNKDLIWQLDKIYKEKQKVPGG